MNDSSHRPLPSDGAPLSQAVLAAEHCDAAGRHVEAVDHLAGAARRGDLEAMTRLAKRLLVGDRAPLLPSDGARFISCAGLEDAQSDSDHDDWRSLAARVDLDAWQSPPAGEDLSASPRVRLIPRFLDEAVTEWLIEKARGRLRRALVYETLSRKTTVSSTRTNTAATLNMIDTDFICVLAQRRMAACVKIPFRQLEPISILHYEEGQEITEHYDFVDPNVPNYAQEIATKGQRVVTFLVYLNEDYDGGETAFTKLGITHKGRRGDALYFVNALPDGSADERTLHAGRPPAQGSTWIVSQFMRDRATF